VSRRLLDRLTDAGCELGHLVFAKIQNTVRIKRGQLIEGHAARQRRNVPVHVPISGLTSEAEDVEPFRRDDATDRLADAVGDCQ
jgi:hypothetical protein